MEQCSDVIYIFFDGQKMTNEESKQASKLRRITEEYK